jgi:DNA-binding NarL/FixJ family response regulator
MNSKKEPDKIERQLRTAELRTQSAALTQGARNANLSRHNRPEAASGYSASCTSGDFGCGSGVRVCLARDKCETPPSGSERSADCILKTVAIVDAHPLFRGGVTQALMEASCFEVIAEGASKSDAVAIAHQHHPDLIILEVSIPGGGVDAAVEILKDAATSKILFLTTSDAESDVLSCLQAGALGYVLKGASGADLINMANAVCRGEIVVTPSLAGRLLTAMNKRPSIKTPTGRDTNLTPREEEIFELVTRGKTNKEVARELNLTEKTIKHYMTNIMLKLGVRNRVEATAFRSSKQIPPQRT